MATRVAIEKLGARQTQRDEVTDPRLHRMESVSSDFLTGPQCMF
ncbi:rCG56453, isoform CRA_b [Rattus norvegicus]|uniref:RCG56453, isoform CRA_b n=1 Tax=Rattus norvegicus TaxID=10116 RepID=A6IAY2_RAT|nr:rCG56453, isoform CRA_b [Rattus norvegicus]